MIDGRRIAGPHVRNACRRHLQDLVDGPARGLTWDLAAAQHIWRWWEGILKLSEGQFEGLPFLLEASQAFRVGSVFGWKRVDDHGRVVRRFRRFYDEEGKGNGKSPLAGGIALFLMTADGEAGAQIYACGSKTEQARVLFNDAVKMVNKAPALKKRIRASGGAGREYQLAHLASLSFFKPISKEAGKKGSGPRPHGALADELHEHPSRAVVEMLERGFKSRTQPLLVMTTNAGSDRNSYCWEEHQHAIRVAAGTMTPDEAFAYVGEVVDDSTFAYVCALDPGDDPIADPSCWIKANPLLGVILSHEYLAGVVKQARQMPGHLNGILRFHFCCWTDSDKGWITRETLEAVLADFDPYTEHRGKPIAGAGVDLSGTTDLTAVAYFVQTGTVEMAGLLEPDGSIGPTRTLPTYDAWIEAFTPADTLAMRAHRDQAPYDVWVREGWLHAVPGERIRYDHVAAHLGRTHAEMLLRLLAYDVYVYEKLREELAFLGLDFPQLAHPQAGRKKGQPHEMQVRAAEVAGRPKPDGLWMPGSLETLETLILERRVRLRRNPVLVSAVMSAAVESDAINNRWFAKSKATQRIDPLVSLAMAAGAAAVDLGEDAMSTDASCLVLI